MEVKGSKTRRARQWEVRLLGDLSTRMLVALTDCSHFKTFVLGLSPPLFCPRISTESAFPTTLSFSQWHDSGQGNKNGVMRERAVVVTFFLLFLFWHPTFTHFLETVTLLPSGELASYYLYRNATFPVFFECSVLFGNFLPRNTPLSC